jgi:hypothetical protein
MNFLLVAPFQVARRRTSGQASRALSKGSARLRLAFSGRIPPDEVGVRSGRRDWLPG